MKWLSIGILVLVVITFSPVKSADASAFSFSIGFHNELSPYGTWVSYSNYGNCWRPNSYSGYQPYVDGYWSYSNYGPTWYGNEAWAPYTYNYGNWIYTAQFGWIWVPGNDWHANEVDWSYGGGYIGWRPRSPSGYYYPGGNDFNLWVVIDSNRFGYHSYRPYAYRTGFARDLFERRVFQNRYNRLDRVQLERVVRRPVRYVSLRERDVEIGNRRTRMYVTPDQEVRIQKHVQQIRRSEPVYNNDRRFTGNDRSYNSNNDRSYTSNDRRFDQRDNVMKQKYEDVRSRSSYEKSAGDYRSEPNYRSKSDFSQKKYEVEHRDDKKSQSKSKEPTRKEQKKHESPSRKHSSSNERH